LRSGGEGRGRPSPILPPGDYWLVLHSGTTANITRRFGDTLTGAERNNTDTYSDGAADPFGTATAGNWSWSTYATYTPVSNATYTYDGDNRRVSSIGSADLRYVWDALADSGIPELTLERTPAGGLSRRYLDGPLGVVSMNNSTGNFYFHQDPLGDVTDLTNASGTAQWKYDYEAYGAPRTSTNVSGAAPENRLRFEGEYLDPETSALHLRARQYDPATGRFGALDSVENAAESPYAGAYVYVDDRPTVLRDPYGLCWICDRLDDAENAATGAVSVVQDATVGLAHDASHAYHKYGGGLDGALAAIDAVNPVSSARRSAQEGYREAGGGPMGVVEGFNRAINPMYAVLVASDACVHASDAQEAGRTCFEAALSAAAAASTGVGATALLRNCSETMVREATDAALARGPEYVRGYMTDAERAAFDRNPRRGSRFVGTALHRAVQQELSRQHPGRFRYSPNRGPDFVNQRTGARVDITTQRRYHNAAAGPGAPAATRLRRRQVRNVQHGQPVG
jgi:RHS repeat-associated protein